MLIERVTDYEIMGRFSDGPGHNVFKERSCGRILWIFKNKLSTPAKEMHRLKAKTFGGRILFIVTTTTKRIGLFWKSVIIFLIW